LANRFKETSIGNIQFADGSTTNAQRTVIQAVGDTSNTKGSSLELTARKSAGSGSADQSIIFTNLKGVPSLSSMLVIDEVNKRGLTNARNNYTFTDSSLITKKYADSLFSIVSSNTSGTYTPSVTGSGTYTASQFMYMRVGNLVHVSGSIEVSVPTVGNNMFSITLPIASNLASDEDASGVISGKSLEADANGINIVKGNPSSDIAEVYFADITNTAIIHVQFDYIIH
jgi:hypothetical protein